jgi:hypothetical protein
MILHGSLRGKLGGDTECVSKKWLPGVGDLPWEAPGLPKPPLPFSGILACTFVTQKILVPIRYVHDDFCEAVGGGSAPALNAATLTSPNDLGKNRLKPQVISLHSEFGNTASPASP